jgi:hypothetical protein
MADQRGSAADQVKALVEAAEQIRAEAEAEASRTREGVERIAQRADELGRQVDELAAGVAEAVTALKAEIEELRDASEAAPVAEDPGARVDPEADDALIAEAEAVAARDPEVEQADTPEGARLLALKMALDGRPREETAAYLRENFELDDPEGLLDEVYARADD